MKQAHVLLAFVFFCACSDNSTRSVDARAANTTLVTPSPVAQLDRTFHEAKRLWESQGISDYDMKLSLETTSFLEPAREVEVQVRDGVTSSLSVPDPSDNRDRLQFYDPYKTVNKMFDQILSLKQKQGSLVDVKYNMSIGYPEVIEYSEPNPDTSFTVRVLEFRVIGAS